MTQPPVGSLDYRLDPSYIAWVRERSEAFVVALIRAFRNEPHVGIRCGETGPIWITGLQHLSTAKRIEVIERADAIYRSVMIEGHGTNVS